MQAKRNNQECLKDLGIKIRCARKSKGWSIEKLSKEIGYSTSIISYWELGKKTPSFLAAKVLEKSLGINL